MRQTHASIRSLLGESTLSTTKPSCTSTSKMKTGLYSVIIKADTWLATSTFHWRLSFILQDGLAREWEGHQIMWLFPIGGIACLSKLLWVLLDLYSEIILLKMCSWIVCCNFLPLYAVLRWNVAEFFNFFFLNTFLFTHFYTSKFRCSERK